MPQSEILTSVKAKSRYPTSSFTTSWNKDHGEYSLSRRDQSRFHFLPHAQIRLPCYMSDQISSEPALTSAFGISRHAASHALVENIKRRGGISAGGLHDMKYLLRTDACIQIRSSRSLGITYKRKKYLHTLKQKDKKNFHLSLFLSSISKDYQNYPRITSEIIF